jgi:uncharacterized pyridoxal phosphate-containing UPF0001 family protein
MTIGALEQSLNASEGVKNRKNADFQRLKEKTRRELGNDGKGKRGKENRLMLSMGMSSDFEAALKAESDIVRSVRRFFARKQTLD